MFKAFKLAIFGALSACLTMATEDGASAAANVTNPVHDGIVARVEAALKSGALWIEDHFHALLDNIETAIEGGTPTADPTPSDTIANVEAAVTPGDAPFDGSQAPNDATPQAADAGTEQTDAPVSDTGEALANEQAADAEQKAADDTPQ